MSQHRIADMGSPSGPSVIDYGLLFVISAIWGSSFLFIKIGVQEITAAPFTTVRLVIAAVLMCAIAAAYGERFLRWDLPWGMIWLSGLFGNALPFILIGWGEERIDSGLAAILMAIAPLATVVLAHFATRDDRMTTGKAIGVALGIFGLIVLMGPDKLASIGDETVRQLAVAAAALGYGVNVLITREIQKSDISPTTLVTGVLITAAVIMVAIQLAFFPWSEFHVTAPSLASAATMAVFHTAVATLLMFKLVARQGPSFFAQVNFLVPIFGVLWGLLILAERPGWRAFAALALILIGMAVARRRI